MSESKRHPPCFSPFRRHKSNPFKHFYCSAGRISVDEMRTSHLKRITQRFSTTVSSRVGGIQASSLFISSDFHWREKKGTTTEGSPNGSLPFPTNKVVHISSVHLFCFPLRFFLCLLLLSLPSSFFSFKVCVAKKHTPLSSFRPLRQTVGRKQTRARERPKSVWEKCTRILEL